MNNHLQDPALAWSDISRLVRVTAAIYDGQVRAVYGPLSTLSGFCRALGKLLRMVFCKDSITR